jgi:hypothetical protein
MNKIKRYYCDPIQYHGVNGLMIYDRKLKGDKSPIAFSLRYAQIICDALNAKEAIRINRRKKYAQQYKNKIQKIP